jgi:hypothetical protein
MGKTITDLMKYQFGLQSGWGQLAAATKVFGLSNKLTITPDSKIVAFQTGGNLAPVTRTAKASQTAKASYDGFASYEQIAVFFEALAGHVEPTGTVNKVRDYAAPLDKFCDPALLTLESGDGTEDGPNYAMLDGLLNKLQISGKSDEAVSVKADFLGSAVQGITLAELEEDDALTPIMGGDFTFALNPFGVKTAPVLVGSTVLSFDLSIEPARTIRVGMGKKHSWSDARWKGSLKVSVEFDAEQKAILDSILGDSVVENVVTLTATNGSEIFAVNFAGYINTAPALFTDDSKMATVDLQYGPKSTPPAWATG